MNLSQNAGAVALELLDFLYNGATLTIYSGTQPASPETALSSNTALASFTFADPPFGNASFGSGKDTASGSFVSASEAPSASGTASFARATINASAWVASHSYAYGAIVTNGGSYYICTGVGTSAASGGPSGTNNGITDGGATWDYYGSTSGQGDVLSDYTVGISGTDVILGTTTISTGTDVDMTSFTQSIPVV